MADDRETIFSFDLWRQNLNPPENASPRSIYRAATALHDAQLVFCDMLEEMADGLPDCVNKSQYITVARSLSAFIHKSHDFEEKTLFPAISCLKLDEPSLNESLERLKYEHWEDESYAEELSESLLNFVEDQSNTSAEALGYMMRSFFNGMRRHIAFEREAITPLLFKTCNSAVLNTQAS